MGPFNSKQKSTNQINSIPINNSCPSCPVRQSCPVCPSCPVCQSCPVCPTGSSNGPTLRRLKKTYIASSTDINDLWNTGQILTGDNKPSYNPRDYIQTGTKGTCTYTKDSSGNYYQHCSSDICYGGESIVTYSPGTINALYCIEFKPE